MKPTHPKTYAAIGLTVVMALTTLGILRFGNPQWHKWIYVFQCYYWPDMEYSSLQCHSTKLNVSSGGTLGSLKDPETHVNIQFNFLIKPPDNYLGQWIDYYKNGNKKAEGLIMHGKRYGEWVVYNHAGNLKVIGEIEKGYYFEVNDHYYIKNRTLIFKD